MIIFNIYLLVVIVLLSTLIVTINWNKMWNNETQGIPLYKKEILVAFLWPLSLLYVLLVVSITVFTTIFKGLKLLLKKIL